MPLARYLPVLLVVAVANACSGGDSNGTTQPTPSQSPSPTAEALLPEGTITFFGADSGDQAGAVMMGDFNGDSARDLAIGATLADGPDNTRADAGEVYLFLGPFPEGGSLDASKGDHDAVFYGAATGDNLGRALASGDFNGDGLDDLAMSAPSSAEKSGAIYVMFGGDLPGQTDFATSGPDVLAKGASAGDYAGIALATGDLDADGRSDLLIGSLLADGPDSLRTDAGAVYRLRGQDLTAGETLDLGSAASVVHGAKPGDHLGESLATGDINGDGATDLVTVAPFSATPDGSRPGVGQTYILLSPLTLPLDLANAAVGPTVIGVDEGDQLGHSVALADVNGDGSDDLWLGAVSADGQDNSQDLAGEAALVLGGPGIGGAGGSRVLNPDATVLGPESEARLGRSLAAGDIDGDGRADLLISAPNVSSRAGAVYLLRGGESLPGNVTDALITLEGLDDGDILGHESFGSPPLLVTDLSDGETAVVMSSPGGDGPDNDRIDCGEVYLIPGSALVT